MKVLIVGAGIGGCAAGWALKRKGFEVELVEKVAEIKEVGAGLSLWSNATKVLKALELEHLLDSMAVGMVDGGLFSHKGTPLSRNNIDMLDQRYGSPNIIAHRAELLSGLSDAVGHENIRLDAPCAGVSQTGERVTLELSSGETLEGDVLIGADGLSSVVRRSLGLPLKIRYAGYTGIRGITTLAECGLDGADDFWGIYIGEGRQFGVLPLSNGRIYWFITENGPPGTTPSPAGQRMDLLERMSHWPAALVKIITHTPDEAILRNDILDQKPISSWTVGRITLLGDAAHATTPNLGQGACLALEDALVLARCLDQGRDAPQDALLRYQKLRMKRAYRVVRQSWWTGKLLQLESPVLCALRDGLMQQISMEKSVEQLAWLLDTAFEPD